MDNLGDKIRALRLARDMTQEQLGERIGVGKAAIQKYESGAVANIKPERIAAMCDAFGVTPSFLMGWQNGNGSADIDDLDTILRLLGEMACKRVALVASLMTHMDDTGRSRVLDIVEDYSLIDEYRIID